MPRRQILNARQGAVLFDLPTNQEMLLRHYTLADDDIEHIKSRRRSHNRFGLALQLCVFRYPGGLLVPGEVTAEGQHYRMAGLNLLAATVIYWNTKQLGIAVTARLEEGKGCLDGLLSHISPLGWAHILLTGEYRWQKSRS